MNLEALLKAPRTGQATLILDHFDYSQTVILQNRDIPWTDPMAYANFVGQGQSLLKPDVTLLHLDRFYAQLVQEDKRLQFEMSAKSRTGFALRTLLADAETIDRVWALANTLTQTQREPVLIQLPSPMRWLCDTHHLSGKDDVLELDADDAENASMYVADWLRNFSTLPVAGLVLNDRLTAPVVNTTTVELETYSPVNNVAENYGWSVVLRREESLQLWKQEHGSKILESGFWSAGSATPDLSGLVFAEIPAEAVPEQVIERLAALRE